MILQVTPHKRYSMRVAYLEIVFVVGGNCWHLEHPKFANEHEIEILTPAAAPVIVVVVLLRTAAPAAVL